MKKSILLFLILFTLLAFSGAASAQDNPPPPEGDRPPRQGPPGPGMQQPPPDDRGEILRQLNLTQDQFQAIRKLLGENQPKVRAAQMDFHDAQEALDDAIYADTVDEALVQNLTRRSADAQATLMRLRTANEFAIRRILTPEQVTKFRELRKEQLIKKKLQERLRRQNGDRPNGQPPNDRPLGQPGQPGMQQPIRPANNQQPVQPRRRPL